MWAPIALQRLRLYIRGCTLQVTIFQFHPCPPVGRSSNMTVPERLEGFHGSTPDSALSYLQLCTNLSSSVEKMGSLTMGRLSSSTVVYLRERGRSASWFRQLSPSSLPILNSSTIIESLRSLRFWVYFVILTVLLTVNGFTNE